MTISEPTWKTQVDKIKASIPRGDAGLLVATLIEDFCLNANRIGHDEPLVTDQALKVFIHAMRGPDLPEWLGAVVDLLFESNITYGEALEAAAALRSHYLELLASHQDALVSLQLVGGRE